MVDPFFHRVPGPRQPVEAGGGRKKKKKKEERRNNGFDEKENEEKLDQNQIKEML